MKQFILLVFLTLSVFASASDDKPSLEPFFQKHCVQCHGEKKQKGKIRLDNLSKIDSELWANIYEQLATEEMPPDDEPQPTDPERNTIKKHALAMASDGGSPLAPGFRRLNKREYGNTVRDLLGLRKGVFDPGEYIYEDEIDEGFDTEAEQLIISNELLLEYLGAAEKSLRLALFSPDTEKPASRIINVKTKRMKGGSNRYVTFAPDHMTLRVGGKAKVYDGESSRVMTAPGRYTITVTASGIDRDRYPVKFAPAEGPLELGIGILAVGTESVTSGGKLLKTFSLKDNQEQTIQFDTWIDKDHYPYLSFVNGSSKPITQIRSNIRRRKIPASAMTEPFVGPGIRVSQYRIDGPFNEEWPSHTLRVTYDSEEIPDITNEEARRQLVLRFANRAFRRPVTLAEIEPYLNYLKKQHAATADWRESIIRTFAAMMASVDFLYLRENQGELDPSALANRLSYFLWSTMPDAELFELANSGEIKDPSVLGKQVKRLLSEPRALRFSQSFADQWLSLDTLGSMPPDGKGEFRIYYRGNLENAMLEETRRFFDYILQENRSVRDFIDSDYTFLNRGLAGLYGVPFDGDDQLVRVTLPPDAKRGGLLGQGSILTLTSNGVETSPVVRGHWVLDEFLGTPPPPAPKEVPALVPDLNGLTTVREQLEKHRSDASCRECHRQMDPLGFALESYDPIGRFRDNYPSKRKVTSYGTYLGTDFNDADELKKILESQIHLFARNLIIKISEYAKGRKLQSADFGTVEEILDRTAANDYRLKDIIVEIATSDLMMKK